VTSVQHWAISHPGCVRTSNQDAYLCRPDIGLFAVADGVGGQAGGDFASQEVVRVLDSTPPGLGPTELLNAARTRLQEVHERLLEAAQPRGYYKPATTIVVLLLHGDHLACLWAGDSRAYVLRRGRLHALTADHSLVGELLRAGDLSEAEAELHPGGNVITRAIGAAGNGKLVDKALGFIEPGDRFLLCSDGLTKTVPPGDVAWLMTDADPAQALLAAALAHEAKDNVTVVVVGC
jgi:protein phosphatase/serine/threonine-protein phosphatase Stp1